MCWCWCWAGFGQIWDFGRGLLIEPVWPQNRWTGLIIGRCGMILIDRVTDQVNQSVDVRT
jgi:hypothetical protein